MRLRLCNQPLNCRGANHEKTRICESRRGGRGSHRRHPAGGRGVGREAPAPDSTRQRKESPMYTLTKLPYAFDALEPYIDARTVEIHHTKHQQTYVNNLNTALEKYPELHALPVDRADRRPPSGAGGRSHEGPQQRRRRGQSRTVLRHDGPEQGRPAGRQAGRGDRRHVRQLRRVPEATRRRGRRPVRQRLGLAEPSIATASSRSKPPPATTRRSCSDASRSW